MPFRVQDHQSFPKKPQTEGSEPLTQREETAPSQRLEKEKREGGEREERTGREERERAQEKESQQGEPKERGEPINVNELLLTVKNS